MSRVSMFICTLLVCLGSSLTCYGMPEDPPFKSDRIYFDAEEVPMGEDAFHIQVGQFEWIATTTVHRDMTGFFTFASDVIRDPVSMAYEKKWKCPYCNNYWPIGTPCQNRDCPSKYKS